MIFVLGLLMPGQEIDELVDDWTPEPLVAPPTSFEEMETEKRAVIVGCVASPQCRGAG